MIATLCFLADVIKSTNTLQTYLQGARLNWYQIPREIARLIKTLTDKGDNPSQPPTSYFGQLQRYLDIAKQSAGGRYTLRSFEDFDVESFIGSFVRPVIADLVTEINLAFDIPQHLKGFAVLDPQTVPEDVALLDAYGKEDIECLAAYYGSPSVT